MFGTNQSNSAIGSGDATDYSPAHAGPHDAAYRYVRHELGVDVVLLGTGDAGLLWTNIASILKPPLPAAGRAKLQNLFSHLRGVGLEASPARIA